jgi:hypothetical protein
VLLASGRVLVADIESGSFVLAHRLPGLSPALPLLADRVLLVGNGAGRISRVLLP